MTAGGGSSEPGDAKTRLRAELRGRRRAHVAALVDRAADERRAADRLLPLIRPGMVVAIYRAIGGEIDPSPIADMAIRRGAAVALPVVLTADLPMRFHAWQPGEPLEPGPFGLAQPGPHAPELIPDLIVTPLLGFDRTGGRIGQGAGFYDRAFVAHPFAMRIGLAWSVQEAPAIPIDPWDVPLHAVATEVEWIDLARPAAG